MKKKMAFAALSAALLMTAGLCIGGCDLLGGSNGNGGTGGSQNGGVSPYEIAAELGYEGSEGGWLASLEGGKSRERVLYEEAKADGYGGTFTEFLKDINAVQTDDAIAVNSALLSAVSIECGFTRVKSSNIPYLPPAEENVVSAGAGVIYSLDKSAGSAYIITNYHVIYDAESNGKETVSHVSDDISVYLYGGEIKSGEMEAEFVGGAKDYDVAVLRIENSEVLKNSAARAVTFGDSDAVTVGERVYAVGNPSGSGISATGGIVSVDAEYISMTRLDADGENDTVKHLEIRIDASVNHGNSGGGLFNAEGKLIGIVNAKTEKSGVEGMGYAIPSNLAVAVAQNVIDNAKVNDSKGAFRATLGVTVSVTDSKSVYDEASGKAYLSETTQVQSVSSGAAAYGKLRAGDILYSVTLNRKETVLTREYKLTRILFETRKGDTLQLKVSRGGSVVSVDILFDSDGYFTLCD